MKSSRDANKPMPIVNRKSEIVNGEWLPDMDLNHDKQIQSLLCYRYTIGQAGAFDRLKGFLSPSSQQTGSALRAMNGVDTRPHPGPLPRGEGVVTCVAQNFAHCYCRRRPSVVRRKTRTTTHIVRAVHNRRMIPPLLSAFAFGFGAIASKRSKDGGERAGVRAEVTTHFSKSRN
jgi:hypothetical protein